jgi:N-acetylglucosamine-6-phosphate deacetylase
MPKKKDYSNTILVSIEPLRYITEYLVDSNFVVETITPRESTPENYAPTPQQIEALMPYGLCIGTHHTNATGTIVNYPECRGVCVDECVNYNDSIYAELISDSMGIHVDPYMQRLVRKIKGDDKIILISDQTIHEPMVIPGLEHVTDLNFTYRKSGGIDISGSKLTLNVACRNYMKHTGASLVNAFQVASYNPAKAVGLTDRGEIAVGKRADLILVDHKMNVHKVLVAGKVQ